MSITPSWRLASALALIKASTMPRCPSQLATIIADWPNCKNIIKVSVVVKSYIFHTIQPSFRYAKWNQDSLYLKLLRVHVQWQLTNHFLSHCRCASQLQLGVHVHVCIMNNTPKKESVYIHAKLEVSLFPSDGKDSRCATLYLILVIHINPFFNKSPDLLLVACFGGNHEIFAELHLKCSSSWATASQNLILS